MTDVEKQILWLEEELTQTEMELTLKR